MAGETLMDFTLGVSESFQPMEVVFPLHHLLNQEFPVRKLGGVWIHNTRHFQLLSLAVISGQREPPPVSCRCQQHSGKDLPPHGSFSFHSHSQSG